ncbi:MAG: MerR family transcriptional regulator [Pleurocapsa sp.]
MHPHEFAEQIGVSVETLRRWDRTKKLPAKRTPSNHRYYTEEDLAVAKGLKPKVENLTAREFVKMGEASD